MAKNDNLTDFLTDVADAIREKKGIEDKINPQNFSDEIKSIETGIVPCQFKDVNFYDYDGVILYSYDWDEFVAKNEMPPLPKHHKHLIAQNWNYTLEEVLEQGGSCDVGVLYDTIDGNSYITIDTRYGTKIEFYTMDLYFTIDWGDGNIETIQKAGTISHTYNSIKRYKIALGRGTTGGIGSFTFENTFQIVEANLSKVHASFRFSQIKYVSVSNESYVSCIFCDSLQHINLNNNSNDASSFSHCYSLKTISIPNNTTILPNIFTNVGINKLHIPSMANEIDFGLTKGSRETFADVTISKNNTTFHIANNCLLQNNDLLFGWYGSSIPNNVETITKYAFYKIHTDKISIPDSVTRIEDNAFSNIPEQEYIYMGKNITYIGSSVFFNIDVIKYYDFRNYEHIPEIANSYTFAFRTNTKVIVPDALYDNWIAAEKWNTSSLVNRIVKASEYVEPTEE